MFIKKTLLVTMLMSVTSTIFAQGLVLNEQNLRTDLNWLNQQGVIQISTSTWPMSGDEIQRALAQAQVSNTAQQKVIASVQAALKAENNMLKAALFAESDPKNIPQAFGDDQKSQYQAALEFNAGGENWDAKIRVNAEKDAQIKNGQDVNVEGSYIAGKLWNQWLIAGQIPTYWGPGHDGSLIRGDASRPVYGFSAQRAEQAAFDSKWLSWIGPWQYQAFAGQLDDYRAVPDAKLIGLRLTAQPLEYLELGASRAIQWGGEGRPESLSSLWDAFVGNKDNGGTNEPDPSNQIAGFDARLNLQPLVSVPVSMYGQYVGEDEAGGLPSKKMYLAGVDYSSSFRNMPYQIYTEWTDTRSSGEVKGISYNHYVYTDGNYQQGFPLGYALGGDAESIALGGRLWLDNRNFINAEIQHAKVNQSDRSTNQAFPTTDKLTSIDVAWEHQYNPKTLISSRLWAVDSDIQSTEVGVGVGIELQTY